jgi:galactokinase
VTSLDDAFTAHFSRRPTIRVQAPGRVNLIGEHTDYNEGLVLPAAISRYVRIAAAANGTDHIRLRSSAYSGDAEIRTGAPAQASVPAWARYLQGVAVRLSGRGVRLAGVDALIDADLPIGSGLSSSAALEVAASLVFEHAAGSRLGPRDRALLCHEAEVEFVGVPCGIMDQFAVSLCRRGHALFLDCRSLETHHIPLPAELAIAVCDTGVRRTVGDSAYAARRRECEDALTWLSARRGHVSALRDVTLDDMPLIEEMPDPLRRRVRHVVTENARVIETARALEGGEATRFREIFLASHDSLRDDYEVSAPELDAMVEAALSSPGSVAARMTGAGFGGAVVALVHRDRQHEFLKAVARGYRRRTDREGAFFASEATDGAQLS